MKLSEFWTNMDYEFGAGYARVSADVADSAEKSFRVMLTPLG